MKYTTKQTRTYDLKNIIAFIFAFMGAKFWPVDSVLLTGAKVQVCNIMRDLMLIFEADKTYKINGGAFTGEQIFQKSQELLDADTCKDMTEIKSGCHRFISGFLAQALFGTDVISTMIFAPEQSRTESYFANARHNNVTKLDTYNKVSSMLALIDDGSIKKQSEAWIEGDKNATRAEAIKIYNRAELVRYHDVDINDICSVTEKQLADIKRSDNPVKAVKEIKANGSEPVVKACNREDTKNVIEYAESQGQTDVADILKAQQSGNKLQAMDLIKAMSK